MNKLGENTVQIDCDVIQADGGTRTASITGAYIALADAIATMLKAGAIKENPIVQQIAAISVGVFEGTPVLDLDYPEDSKAETDMNVVMGSNGGFIEVQGTAEAAPFARAQLNAMLDLAEKGIGELFEEQSKAFTAEV